MKKTLLAALIIASFSNVAYALDALRDTGPVSIVTRIGSNLQEVITPVKLESSVQQMLNNCGVPTKGADKNHQLLIRVVGIEFERGALAFAVLVEHKQPATLWDNKIDWEVSTFSHLWSGAYPSNERYIINVVSEGVNSFCREYNKANELAKTNKIGDKELMSYTNIIFRAQTNLAKLGFPVGKPDGRDGRMTRQSVIAFQKQEGMERTGTITKELVSQIEKHVSYRANCPSEYKDYLKLVKDTGRPQIFRCN